MSQQKPRVLVLTDISSLTAGVREPDDGQSMVRLMLYTNDLDIEGLVASSNLGHGQTVRPELIHQVVDAYEKVRPNLLKHDTAYPDAARLRERIKAGQPVAGPKVPVMDSIGKGRDTGASDWIIRVTDAPDPRPLWVTIWGGSADLAQALWKVRETRPKQAAAAFTAKLRVHSIGDQDSTGAWIKENFPNLFYLTRHNGIRGMYRGGDISLSSPEWVEKNVRQGHGSLGALYPNYDGGDIWSSRLGRVRGIKEGDTPSILALIPNGLNDPEHPERGGWGGLFQGEGTRWIDAEDPQPSRESDPDPRMAAVYRWRSAFQNDFAARMDWCVRPFADANHPPIVRIAGPRERTARPGETITLDASATTDPDKDRLSFAWTIYPQSKAEYREALLMMLAPNEFERPVVSFVAPRVPADTRISFLLTVTDGGDPPLTRYGRVYLTIKGS